LLAFFDELLLPSKLVIENDRFDADFLVSIISTSTSSPELVSEPFVSDEAEPDEPPHESSVVVGRKKVFVEG